MGNDGVDFKTDRMHNLMKALGLSRRTVERQLCGIRSLQASQQGTKTQEATKEEEKRRIEAKDSNTSTTRLRYEASFDE